MKFGLPHSRQRQRAVLQPLVEACGCPVNRSPHLIGARSPSAFSQKFPPFLATIPMGAQFALPVGSVLPPSRDFLSIPRKSLCLGDRGCHLERPALTLRPAAFGDHAKPPAKSRRLPYLVFYDSPFRFAPLLLRARSCPRWWGFGRQRCRDA